VKKIARLFLRLAEDWLQLVRPFQFLDQPRPVGCPMFQNQIAQPVHIVHLFPPSAAAPKPPKCRNLAAVP
jgi:hypothetical protein